MALVFNLSAHNKSFSPTILALLSLKLTLPLESGIEIYLISKNYVPIHSLQTKLICSILAIDYFCDTLKFIQTQFVLEQLTIITISLRSIQNQSTNKLNWQTIPKQTLQIQKTSNRSMIIFLQTILGA